MVRIPYMVLKLVLKSKISKNFAKFWRNFTLFSLITPQRKKISDIFFRPKCSLASCGKFCEKTWQAPHTKMVHLGFISLEKKFRKRLQIFRFLIAYFAVQKNSCNNEIFIYYTKHPAASVQLLI